jgi:RNA polymerase sigma-70 factor (ECF subfamily)
LTVDQQHVLALRFAEEYSLEETAHIMGKTIGAVKTLQFRALAALRRLLEEKSKQ